MTTESFSGRLARKMDVPIGLINPTKRLVEVAMLKVREGEIDSFSRQKATFENTSAHRLFEITDVHVRKAKGKIVSVDGAGCGLFIYEIELDMTGKPIKRGLGVQIPRARDAVSVGNMYHLRTVQPSEMERLADELSTATKVPEEKYDAANNALFELEKDRGEANLL